MSIEVLIKRKVKQGGQARQLIPLILQLRSIATRQPGYISGTTLSNIEHPEECLVVSKWESVEHWERWRHSKERADIDGKIDALTGEKTEYNIYEPMVGHSFS